jgi:putative membrane protein
MKVMNLVARLLINVLALWVVDYLVPGMSFASWQALFVSAIVIGIVNTFIKPVLQVIALPITIVTFGIGAILINVLLLWFVSYIVPGFEIDVFLTAVIASLLLSLVSWFLHRLTKE